MVDNVEIWSGNQPPLVLGQEFAEFYMYFPNHS